MRLPHGVIGQPGKQPKKKMSEAVSILNQSGVLKEFGTTESNNQIQCYLPVAPGDNLTMSFEIPSGEVQIIDILIDGIVRETIFNNRGSLFHRGKVTKVCACERRPSGSKGKLELYDMVVQARTNTKGNYIQRSIHTSMEEFRHFVCFQTNQTQICAQRLPVLSI
jgi:hypothetical protein